MRCAAHTLNLIATKDTEEALSAGDGHLGMAYRSAMNNGRGLWNKQSRSTNAAELIYTKFGRKLVVPNKTRWNSTYDAIKCIVDIIDTKCEDLDDFNQVITAIGGKPKLNKFLHSNIKFFRDYVKVMAPIANALDMIQAEETAFMGILLPIICLVIDEIATLKEDPELELVKPLAEALLTGLHERFDPYLESVEFQCAAGFHPMFRLGWMDQFKPDSTRLCKDAMITLVLEELKKLSNYVEVVPPVATPEPAASSQGATATPRNWLSKIILKKKDAATVQTGDEALNALARRAVILMEAWLVGQPETDALCLNDKAFMGEIAFINLFRRFNTGLPSSAAVERLFSIGKLILRDNRSNLSDDNFNKLMFIKGNIGVV